MNVLVSLIYVPRKIKHYCISINLKQSILYLNLIILVNNFFHLSHSLKDQVESGKFPLD